MKQVPLGLIWLGITGILALLAPCMVGEGGWYAWPAGSFSSTAGLPPGTAGHLLGTDGYGRDILSGLIQSCRSLWMLCFPAALLTGLVGIFAGVLEVYFHREPFRISLLGFLGFLVSSIYLVSMAENYRMIGVQAWFVFPIPFLVFWGLSKLFLYPLIRIPVLGGVELLRICLTALPGLWLILSFSTFLSEGYLGLIALIGCTGWVGMARIAKTEGNRISHAEWFLAAKGLGLKKERLWVGHLIKNLLPHLWPIWIGLFGGCILLESSLSFLGIGLPDDHLGWGSMLRHGKFFMHYWWTMALPALCISLSVGSAYQLLNRIQKKRKYQNPTRLIQ